MKSRNGVEVVKQLLVNVVHHRAARDCKHDGQADVEPNFLQELGHEGSDEGALVLTNCVGLMRAKVVGEAT